MERLAPEQRLQIVQLYYENSRSVRNVFRALRSTYGQHNRPTERTIRNTITHFETQHSLLDNIRPNRPRPARCVENIAAVAENVHEDRGESIRRRSQQLGLTYGTTRRILRRDLKLSKININDDEPSSPPELSQLEKEKARKRYEKLDAEGKTAQAKADLARLVLIKQQRGKAAAKREAEMNKKKSSEKPSS